MIMADAIICDATGERRADIKIEEGTIVEIGENLQGGERISAGGAYLLPGFIDTNVRLKDAQLSGKNLETLSIEALRGGVSEMVLVPDSTPRIDNEITLEFVQKHRSHEEGAVCESAISALGENGALSNIAILLKKGGVGVYTPTITDYNLITRIAQYVKMAEKPLFYAAIDKSLSESGVMADGAVAGRLGLPGISPLGEIVHIASMIEVARHFGIKVVFKNVTEPRSIELIAQAKGEGIDVESEVAIHHLLRSDTACIGFNTDAKIHPPLVSEEKRLMLMKALQEGKIDSLTALHHPGSDVNKELTFYDASYGSRSIGEYLALCYTHLVKTGDLSMSRLVQLACAAPARQIGMERGTFSVGKKADLVVFDPSKMSTIEHPHSLYKSEELSGAVTMAVRDGKIVRF